MFKKRVYKIKNSCQNMKIAFISDLHNKKIKENSRIFSIIENIKPDIIIFGGDMISRKTVDFSNFEMICKKCSAIAVVYSAPGNHELSVYPEGLEIYRRILKKYNIIYLENETAELGKEMYLTGLKLRYSVYKDENDSYKNLHTYTSDELYEDAGTLKKGYNIIIAHNPNCFNTYEKWGADLVLSGHIHGGIIRFPVIGGILSPERKFFPEYSLGLYEKGKTKMIVSAGIGKFRLFNPSEVVEIDLIK